jgi:hypothetical protein
MNFTKYIALVSDVALGFKLPLVSVNVQFDTIQCYFSCVTEIMLSIVLEKGLDFFCKMVLVT